MTQEIYAAPSVGELFDNRTRESRLGAAFRRYRSGYIGGFMFLMLVCMAVFAPFLGTVDPTAIAPRLRAIPPSPEHWFGTDILGRDLYSRVIYGIRTSLLIGISVAAIATAIGVVVGLVAGYFRSIDALLMRFLDAIMSIPSLLLAITLVTISRPSAVNVVIALSVSEMPRVCRVVRSMVLSLREMQYVEAAVSSGTRSATILFRHVLPNASGPIIVQATYICAAAMIAEAALSFIGAGTPPTIPSWGNIMAEGRALWQVRPHTVLIPAAFLSLSVLSVNMIGDALRDKLDPRFSHGR